MVFDCNEAACLAAFDIGIAGVFAEVDTQSMLVVLACAGALGLLWLGFRTYVAPRSAPLSHFEEDVCAICLGDLYSQPMVPIPSQPWWWHLVFYVEDAVSFARVLPCTHTYHGSCFARLVRQKKQQQQQSPHVRHSLRCPLCNVLVASYDTGKSARTRARPWLLVLLALVGLALVLSCAYYSASLILSTVHRVIVWYICGDIGVWV